MKFLDGSIPSLARIQDIYTNHLYRAIQLKSSVVIRNLDLPGFKDLLKRAIKEILKI